MISITLTPVLHPNLQFILRGKMKIPLQLSQVHPREELLILKSMTASALTSAGIYPLDQLKVRLQNGTSSREAESTAQAAAENSAKTGFFSTVKEKLIHAYGPYDPAKGVLSYAKNSVYKGYVPYMTVMCSSTGIINPLHDIFQRTLRNNLPETMSRADKSLYSNVAGGAAATAVSQVVNIPQYNYRTNQSLADLEGGKKYTPAGFVKEAIKNPKIATKGLGIAPAYSASMATYYYLFDRFKKEQLKKADKTTSSELTLFNNFLASSQARFLVSLGVHPFDTVRIRKQKTDQTYPQIAKGLYREGGIRRFYKGLAVSALRNSMSTGISMALYQKLRIWWEQENKPKAKD